MKRNIAYLLSLALLVATSCSNEVDQFENSADTAIEFTASMAGGSRAADGLQTAFATGDQVGMYIVTSNGSTTSNMADNKLFELNSSGYLEATDGTRYFYPINGYTTKVYAYKPYSAQGIVNNTFYIKTDQTTDAGYIASDLLWGVPKNGNPVSASREPIALDFEHRCAKLVVNLTVADGMNLEGCELSTSSMETGMKLSSLESGTFDVPGYYYNSSVKFGKLTSAASQTHAAVLVPQKFQAGWTFLNIKFANGNNPLVMKLTSELNLEAGKVCTLSVTARRNSLVVDNMTIMPWTASQQHDGAIVQDKILNLSTLTADYTVDSNFILTGTTSYKITIADGVSVKLKDATINNQIVCSGNATITLKGTNKVSYQNYAACIKIGPEGTTLTINGTDDDILEVTGSCGIGNGNYDIYNSGNIVINGGKITAKGYPAIGSYNREIGNITINDGIIYAECPGWDSAGIGSRTGAKCGDINILGGDVTAIGGKRGSAVGNGFQGGSSTNSIVIKNCRRFYAVSEDGGTCVGSGQQSNNFASITIENCPEVIFEKRTGGSYMKATPIPTVTNSKIYARNPDTGELTDITDQFTN